MQRNGFRFRSGFVVAALILVASILTADAPMEDASKLVAGSPIVFGRADRFPMLLAQSEDALIRFEEIAGEDVVMRLVPMDRNGSDVGSGKIVVILPNEERRVRLRDALAADAISSSVHLRIEVRRGTGVVSVTTDNEKLVAVNATSSRRRAVSWPAPLPSSITLIDRAEASGALDSETALVYRVFALFGDARLPQAYRGDDSKIEDSLYLEEVRDRMASLSDATQAIVQPFLIPPAYQGSYANAATPPKASGLFGPPPCQFFSDRWVYANGVNVKVWYSVPHSVEDAKRARDIVAEIDGRIWPSLGGLMAPHVPLSDNLYGCNGDDGRLDLYLDDVERSFFIPFGLCSAPTPGYIVLDRRATLGFPTVVHEIFHAFQYSYQRSGCLSSFRYRWWGEASATWSQDYVYGSIFKLWKSADDFLSKPEAPLDLRDDRHEYGAYLLPFFLHRIKGLDAGFVKASWEKLAGKSAVEALDEVLPGKFAAIWPEFVRANWNLKPADDYSRYDGMPNRAKTEPVGGDLLKGTAGDEVRSIKVDLPHLSATYKNYDFWDSASLVVFYNGVTSDLRLEDGPLFGIQYTLKPAQPERVKHARVQALIKLEGQNWKAEDWTNRDLVIYCRDIKAERIEELVLIISNSDIGEDSDKLRPAGLDPVLFTSNIGCHKWTGTVVHTDPSSGLVLTSRVTFEQSRTEGSIARGTQHYQFNGPCGGEGNQDIDPSNSHLVLPILSPPQSAYHRSYWGVGADSRKLVANCPGVGDTPLPVVSWFQTGLPPPRAGGNPTARFLRVDPTGKLIAGDYKSGVWGWSWNLVAEREY